MIIRAIKKIILDKTKSEYLTCFVSLALFSAYVTTMRREKKLRGLLEQERRQTRRFSGNYFLINQWNTAKYHGKRMDHYFKEKGYRKVAIYGAGELGKMVLYELAESDIEIAYFIDKGVWAAPDIKNYVELAGRSVPVFLPDNTLPPVDAVIISTISIAEKVGQDLHGKIFAPFVTLEKVIAEL